MKPAIADHLLRVELCDLIAGDPKIDTLSSGSQCPHKVAEDAMGQVPPAHPRRRLAITKKKEN